MRINPISTFFYRNYNLYRFDRRIRLINENLLIENEKLRNQFKLLTTSYGTNTNKLVIEFSNQQKNELNQNILTIKNSIIDYINAEVKTKFNYENIRNYEVLLKNPDQTINLINSGLIYLSPNLKNIDLDLYNKLISPIAISLDQFLSDAQIISSTINTDLNII